ncbi:hypothetical protein D3C80_1199730 [compost metagenome]
MQHANSQFDTLAFGNGRLDYDLLADDHYLVSFSDVHCHGFVEQSPILPDSVQGIAQGWLMAEKQADRTEIGKLPRLGQAQTKCFAVASLCRYIQQFGDNCHGYP